MEITTKSFQKEILESKEPVLLECWASWCLPCKQIDPALSKLAKKYKGRCRILKINLDKNPLISHRYNVKGLPTFITFLDGKEIERKTGSQTDTQLIEMFENVIKESNSSLNEECKSTDSNEFESDDEQEIIEERLRDLGYL